MPIDWKMSGGTNLQGKEDVMSCGVCEGVKLLEHAMHIV